MTFLLNQRRVLFVVSNNSFAVAALGFLALLGSCCIAVEMF